MGIERTLSTQQTQVDWPALVTKLHAHGETPVLRMIDGLPAFPDEIPDASWNELRIGLNGGMVTLKRTANGFSLVTWGTTDPQLDRSTNALYESLQDLIT